MVLKNYLALSSLLLFVFFTGCSKQVDEYNKPAIYWYSKLVQEVSNGDLERADNYYSSLQGEHIGSPLLPEATMILAIAHMHFEEYLLSNHFLDEYIKRYATTNETEQAEFLKIKSKYMALPNPRRDQALIDDAIAAGEKFKINYPDSMYLEVVNTMLTRLYLAQAVINETIADLYERIDKPKAAAYYKDIKPQPWIVWSDIDRANTPWYREWFEGDGTSSWYEFMIPDTQSVVSRNSISEEINSESFVESKTGSEVNELKELSSESDTEEKEDTSSWYDFMNPWSDDSEKLIEEKTDDDSSWYDFMVPWS